MAKDVQLRAPKGMNDILPAAKEPFFDSAVWSRIHTLFAEVLEQYGFRHVHLPLVEDTALFARGIGEQTDIVAKEMYSFTDRGGRQLTLRPEGTAGAARAYVQHNFAGTSPQQRWWYDGPMFRAERPQAGRYRQFYQIGAELFGSDAPAADAEMVAMLWQLCARLGLSGIAIRINSLGDSESRAAFRASLLAFLRNHTDRLCESCQERLELNPLRVLDCKRPDCRTVVADAPSVIDDLTPAARDHFEAVCTLLDTLGVPYKRDPKLVRGLDYYTGTLFEFTTTALGAQDAILGGGRYDNLVAELGGIETPAVGFAAGIERIAMLLTHDAPRDSRDGPHLYIVPMEGAEAQALQLAQKVRGGARGWRVQVDGGGGRLKQQMRRADKSGAHTALVLGESELAQGKGRLKDLAQASEHDVELTPGELRGMLDVIIKEEEPKK